MASKQEYAESIEVSKENARAKRQCNEIMVDKGLGEPVIFCKYIKI